MNAMLVSSIIVAVTSTVSPVYAAPAEKPSSAPVMKQIMIDDADGQPFNLAELGSVIAKHKDSIRVLFSAGPNDRPKAYHDIDLKEGDIILMMNGKKVNSTDEIQKAYDGITIGQNVQFGVQRDGKLMLVSFPKADPKDLPQRKMMMMTNDGNGKPGDKQVFTTNKIEIPDDIKDVEPVPGLGLMLGTKDNKLVIAVVMPFAQERGDLKGLKPRDEIVSLNGKAVSKVSEFVASYEALKVGDKLTIAAKRGSDNLEVALAKPEDNGAIQIMHKK